VLATVLRIHLQQQWHSLSDSAMEEALIEVPTMRRFAGIDLVSDRIPVENIILTFRHLLEKHELGEQIFDTVKAHLSAQGMTMRQGTLVDTTLMAGLGFPWFRGQVDRSHAMILGMSIGDYSDQDKTSVHGATKA